MSNYFALLCNSSQFNICKAAAHNEIGTWLLPRGNVQKGDRIAFWRTLDSQTKNRGIVMFGEVLEEAKLRYEIEGESQFWIKKPNTIQRRILLRYVGAKNTPLWLNENPTLSSLSVSRSQGNKAYKITKEQWNDLMTMAGGWNSNAISIVQGKKALRRSIAQFHAMAQNNQDLAIDLIRKSSYFVFDPEQQCYGASKFVAWTGMNEDLYQKARKKEIRLPEKKFCGNATRKHIEDLLEKKYIPVQREHQYLIQWAESLFGKGILKGIMQEKWKFLSIDEQLWNDVERLKTEQDVATVYNTGQRYSNNTALRKAIENHAMTQATLFYETEGWDVKDTSAHKPYDLFCTKGRQKKYIEVKGTMSIGEHVFVTYNEVEHAKSHVGECVLFVVHDIAIKSIAGKQQTYNGEISIQDPWIPKDTQLKPINYRYNLK